MEIVMSRQDNLLKRYERKISCLKEDGEVSIIPVTERLSNIYENGDSPKYIKFRFDTHGKDAEYILKLTLELPFGDRVGLDSAAAKDGAAVTVSLPDLSDVYGIFTLYVTAERDGETICVQPIPFSHIRSCGAGFKKSGFGTHLIYHDGQDTYDCIEILRKAGIRKIRDDLNWCFCEYEKGKPEVNERFRNTVPRFLDAGIETNLLLLYGNDFYDGGGAPETEEGLAAYVKYCEAMVTYFKGKVNHYEIWNEYNLGFGRTNGAPEKYVWQLKAAYKAIKAIDPNIVVSAAVTSGTQPEWLRRMMKAGAYDYFDAVSIHPYCGIPDSAYPDENNGQTEANVKLYKDIIAEYGPEKPVWVSEMGWTSSAFEGTVDRDEQAAHHVRTIAIAESSDIIDKMLIYDFRDDGTDPFEMEHHWGIVEAMQSVVPNAAKESYAAVSFLNCMISDGEFSDKEVIDSVKITRFGKGDKTVNLLWSLDGEKTVTAALSESDEIFDIYGNKKNIEIENGKATFNLGGSVIYTIGSKAEITKVKMAAPKYDFPYTLTAVPCHKADGWYLKAVLKNHSYKLAGRLKVDLPELNICGNYSRFSLKNGERFEAEIKVGEADYRKLYRAVIDLNLESGVRDVRTELTSFFEIPRGETSKANITMNAADNYFYLEGEEKPELNAEISLSYDEERLYLNAVVEDRVHLQRGTTSDCWMDIWDGDGIEIIIQPIYDGNPAEMRYNHIGLALSSDNGDSIAWRWRLVSNRSQGYFRTADFKAERRGGNTFYRAAFDWKDLLPPNVALEDCDSFGFALRVNNAGSNPSSIDGYMQLYGGLSTWRAPFSYQPSEFGRFVLKK